MTPNNPLHFSAFENAEFVAKYILEALVRDLHLRPGDFVYQKSLHLAFQTRGATPEQISRGVEHVIAQGWLCLDFAQRTYTLTQAGLSRL